MFDEATPHRLVLEFEAVTSIDVTAALKRLLAHVTSTGAELCLARTRQPVLDQLSDAGLVAAIGRERLFATVSCAVERPRATPAP